ncbi:DUF2868 domain-containing protein [Poriferisphaera sp. WC338]|uniref:DUF2868 domain-containing protein n=1 Tax=Poriferisphaera sp. WC338 TaxID=3425129 RepID=UPI003D815649
MKQPSLKPNLASLLSLRSALSADTATPDHQKYDQDQAYRNILGKPATPTAKLLLWLQHTHLAPNTSPLHKTARATTFLLIILALILGCSASLSVFLRPNNTPINIFLPITFFILLQLLLVLLNLILFLPPTILARFPFIAHFQDLLLSLSPGRFITLLSKLLPLTSRTQFQALQGDLLSSHTRFAPLQKSILLYYAAVFTFTLNLAIIITFIILLLTNDLSFAYASTIDIPQSFIQNLTQSLAIPFAWVNPNILLPSDQLIANSRYIPGSAFPHTQARAWYPFLLAALLTYGLLPRLLIFLLASYQLRKTITQTIPILPHAQALLNRLQSTPIPTSQTPQTTDNIDPISSNRTLGIPPSATSIIHDDALTLNQFNRYFPNSTPTSLPSTSNTLNLETDTPICLITLLYQPPTLETLNLIKLIRSKINTTTPIHVALVPFDHQNRTVSTNPNHLKHWQLKTRSLADPHLTLTVLQTTQHNP